MMQLFSEERATLRASFFGCTFNEKVYNANAMKTYEQPIWVQAGEHGWVNINEVKVEDVSEDPFGFDEYTFAYQDKNGLELMYQSRAIRGSRPG